MKPLGTALVMAAILCSGCSTLKVSTDFMPGTDFTAYKTFAFKDVVDFKNAIFETRLKNAVATQLVAKGMARKDENPDLWVVLRPRLTKETQINTVETGGYGYGMRYGGMGMGTATTTVQEIPVGTLVIDLVDAKAKQMVWRGTASDSLKQNATPEERDQNLNQAMTQLFANYPPKK
jgi:hypothetical protein